MDCEEEPDDGVCQSDVPSWAKAGEVMNTLHESAARTRLLTADLFLDLIISLLQIVSSSYLIPKCTSCQDFCPEATVADFANFRPSSNIKNGTCANLDSLCCS